MNQKWLMPFFITNFSYLWQIKINPDMKNALSIIVVLAFLFALGCADFCSEQDQKIADLQLDLVRLDSAFFSCKTDFSNSIKSRDTLELEKAQLQASLQNCQSTINQNQSAYQASLNNKQTEITSLTNALKAKTIAYDDLYDLYTGLLSDNYIIYKPNVITLLTDLNGKIFESETALNHLNNIEPKDETTLEAIQETKLILANNKGQRTAIGQLTGIQVQN